MLNPLAAIVVLLSLGLLPHQQPAAAQRVDWAADDGKRVAELMARGRRIDGKHVVVWTPSSMSEADQRALVARLDRGLAALREMVGSHSWQIVGRQKITYYISDDRFVSHASAQAAVFIPLARLEDGRAPFLHEAVHELLSTAATRSAYRSDDPPTRPIWFSEGLADYISYKAMAKFGLTEGDLFGVGGLTGVDRTCAERLKGPAGADVLPFMGASGGPEVLFTSDRIKVAPTFYACGFSFTKFIVDRIGLAPTVTAASLMDTGDAQARLEKLLGKSLSAARTDWLRAIGYDMVSKQ